MSIGLRIAGVLAFLHLGASWYRVMSRRLEMAAGSSAQVAGVSIAAALLAAGILVGVIRVWHYRRSGLVVLGLFYLAILSVVVHRIYVGLAGWEALAWPATMLVALWSPHAWRVCRGRSERAEQRLGLPS